jgi:DNA-binding MarR family transcriptional regulator
MPEKDLPHAFYRVLRLHQLVGARIESALESVAMTAHQYTVLSLIRRHAPVSSAEIARKLGITAQSAGESIKSLEVRDLVVRKLLPEDRRSHALGVTPQGRRALTRADKLVLAAEDDFFAHLSTAERSAFEDTIQRLRFPRQEASAVDAR